MTFGEMKIYEDRIVAETPFTHEIIPISKIANVTFAKFAGKLIIETSGGNKSEFRFWKGLKAINEIMNLISSLKKD